MVGKSFDWLCTKISSGKFPSPKSFSEFIGLTWSELKPSLSTSISTDLLLSIRSKCDKVYKFLSDLDGLEIITHNQEFEYPTDKFVVSAKCTMIRHKTTIYSFYVDSLVLLSRSNRLYPIAFNILKAVTKDLTKGFSYSIKPYIFKCQSVSLHSFESIDKLDDVIDGIIIGIQHSLYPVPSINCSVCDVRSKCSWYDIKN